MVPSTFGVPGGLWGAYERGLDRDYTRYIRQSRRVCFSGKSYENPHETSIEKGLV